MGDDLHRATTSLLVVAGLLALAGLCAGVSGAAPGEAWVAAGRHCLHLACGLAVFLAALSIPVEAARRAAPGLVVLVFLVLLGMLVSDALGATAKGAERWVRIAGVSFQPSVLLQCLWPMVLASWAARDPLRLQHPPSLWRLMAGFALLVLPVLLQPDLGSVLILLGVTGITLFFAGAPLRLLRQVVPLSLLALGAASLLFGHVATRVDDWIHGRVPMQVDHALDSLAAGGLAGRGPGAGVFKHGYVPEGGTDFVLALIGEEWGLLGVSGVAGLYFAFTALGVHLARRARTRYGAILMAAATVMVAIQAALNMAVVAGIMPPKGLPLPFISRGGSSLVCLAALLGLAFRAAREPRVVPGTLSDPSHLPLPPWSASNAWVS